MQLLLFVLHRDVCSPCSPEERTQPFPTRAVFTCQICAIPFAFDARCLWQATLIRGRKKWVHNKKLKKQNKASGKRKRPERGEGASTEAESSVLPSIVLWSRWLLPSFVVFSVACVLELWHSSCRPSTSLQTRLLPALSVVLVSSPLLSTALYPFLFWWLLSDDRQAQGK